MALPILVVEKGREKGLSATVPKGGPLIVGRDPSCGMVVQDTMISRQHFKIFRDGPSGAYLAEDLSSMNGTFLNESILRESVPLAFGDTLAVGLTRFTFLEGEKQKKKGALSGKTIGGYEIGERIGRGGMGTVYLATQISLHRQVALKFLAPHLTQDVAFVRKFVQEARSAGALNHPNIIQVYDVAEHKGLHYFSMEYASEGSIEEALHEQDRIEPIEALDIVLDAARGIEYADRQGIVHRDIKPDNLMKTEDGTVKIGDMGLAIRHTGGSKEENIGNYGTPHFASPEQIRGVELDVRSDLYSLGATFYRLLAGQTPFTGKNVREIMIKQVKEPPPPILELAPDLPPAIVETIERLMEKSPDDRFASPTELIERLESIQDNLHRPSRTRGSTSRPSPGILIGGALVAAVILGSLLFSGPSNQTPPPEETPSPKTGNGQSSNRPQIAEADLLQALSALQKAPDSTEALERLHQVASTYPDLPAGQTALEEYERAQAEAMARLEVRLLAQIEAIETIDPQTLEPTAEATEQYRTLARQHPETKASKEAAKRAESHEANRLRFLQIKPAADSTWNGLRSRIERHERQAEFRSALELARGYREMFDHPAFQRRADEEVLRLEERARERFATTLRRTDQDADRNDFDRAIEAMNQIEELYGIEDLARQARERVKTYRQRKEQHETERREEATRIDSERFERLRAEVDEQLENLDLASARAALSRSREPYATDEFRAERSFLDFHVEMLERLFQTFAEKSRSGRFERAETKIPDSIRTHVERVFRAEVQTGTIVDFNPKSAEVKFEIQVPNRPSIILGRRISDLPPERIHDILVGPPRWDPNLYDRLGFMALSVVLELDDEAQEQARTLEPQIAALNGDGAAVLQDHFARYQDLISHR